MSRKILLIRHALSEANNRDNIGKPIHGSWGAPLMDEGREQAKELGKTLETIYGIDVANTPVAVSEIRRAQETAEYAGFTELQAYSSLNEFDADDWPGLLQDLADGHPPRQLLDCARELLANPPEENIWITHGVLIAAIGYVLRVERYGRQYPYFCEITPITID
ncbi:histidine phosphatase family protein [Candidatus Saccharibacteria bacterium]|nr:histidine phosphatase family protein [Candidatus Saccharibacteria bacterium]